MIKNKAFFLDRDGVIIKNVPYLNKIEKIEFTDGIEEAIKMINKHGYKCIVISNQSGIARGIVKMEKVIEINEHIKNYLETKNAIIDAVYFCPHHIDGIVKEYSILCECRKPKAGMLTQAAKDYNIDLLKSYMIGDKKSDVDAGEAVGCKSFQLRVTNNSFQELIEITKHILD